MAPVKRETLRIDRRLEWYTALFDHYGTPIRTQGDLECILKGNVYAYVHNTRTDRIEVHRGGLGEHSVSRVLSGELPFDTCGGTMVLLNHLPQWLVLADAHF